MVKLSRFAYVYNLGNAVALYHSLRMKPVYLNQQVYRGLQDWLASPFCSSIIDAPNFIKKEVEELTHYKILINSESDDDKVLSFVQSKIPKPAINVCYMILSEQCNLACKYCFLGNNDADKRQQFLLEDMTTETADKAISFFIRQIKLSSLDTENNNPFVIFYGGEPLMNYPTLVYVAERLNSLREKEPSIKNVEMYIITNGLLLNEERILKLKELGVNISISIDGFTEDSNKYRVDLGGKSVHSRVLKTLDLSKRLGVEVSLSVTLCEDTIKDTKNIFNLIDNYGIKTFGFNIMMPSENFVLSQSYNEAAAQFIIDAFKELRSRGIHEDRIMRKLKAFANAQVYFSDCAATAGGRLHPPAVPARAVFPNRLFRRHLVLSGTVPFPIPSVLDEGRDEVCEPAFDRGLSVHAYHPPGSFSLPLSVLQYRPWPALSFLLPVVCSHYKSWP